MPLMAMSMQLLIVMGYLIVYRQQLLAGAANHADPLALETFAQGIIQRVVVTNALQQRLHLL
ncbi:hypothetical protein HMPREF1590_00972 [Escherichia coli 113302]|nr:hypothetical protein HMPREF1590_00972 [Escherichia coli 113302]